MIAALNALATNLSDPAFLVIVGPIALVAALFLYIEHRADKQDRIKAARAEENRRTLEHIARCNNRNGALWCDRAAHHDGPHADSRTGHDYPLTWRDYGGAA